MNVRDAEPADLALVRDLIRAAISAAFDDAGLRRPSKLPGPLQHEIAHPDERYQAILVATQNADRVGCVALRPLGDGQAAVMNRLYVRAEHRRLGIGRKLTTAAIDRARQLDYRRVMVDVIPQRVSVIRFYESLGFRDVEPFTLYPFPMRFLGLNL